MEKIKKITFYIVLFSVILGSCGRHDEEDVKQLIKINEQVESLYNEEMNDLAADISVDKLEEAETRLQVEQGKEFNEKNQEILDEIKELYLNALMMYALEADIQDLFVDEGVDESVELEDIEQLSTRFSKIDAEKWANYVSRQNKQLAEVEEQLTQVTSGVGSFEGMYLSSDNIILYIDDTQFLAAENVANDNLACYEVTEIIKNTGQELTLTVYQEPIESFGIEGGYSEEKFYLSGDDANTVTTVEGTDYERLSQAEIKEIYRNLPGIKDLIE